MSKILSVHSFRGGTGKSSTTSNVAVNVALQGYRVGVVDCDIQSPGIHVLFGMKDQRVEHSLNDYLWGQCSIEAAAHNVRPLLQSSYDGTAKSLGDIFLIPSSIKAGEIARVLREGYDVGLLNDGLHQLVDQLKLDYLFVDTHPGLNEETLLSIAISDMLLLLMRPDQQDFQGTAVTVEVARKLDVPRMALVVNMALTSLDFDALRHDVEAAYGVPVAGILPLSEDVIRLASNGIFSLKMPDHPWSRTIKQVAEHITT